jgi:hypothetical protein
MAVMDMKLEVVVVPMVDEQAAHLARSAPGGSK